MQWALMLGVLSEHKWKFNGEIMDNMSVLIEERNIVIRLPIDLLIYAQKHRPDMSIKILNTVAMARHFEKEFLHFHDGLCARDNSNFEQLLDDFFMDAAEDAREWLECKDLNL